MQNYAAKRLEVTDCKKHSFFQKKHFHLGLSMYQMDTARVGRVAKHLYAVSTIKCGGGKDVFVTDGAAMSSSNCMNSSLTYMALTAWACNYAVKDLKKEISRARKAPRKVSYQSPRLLFFGLL